MPTFAARARRPIVSPNSLVILAAVSEKTLDSGDEDRLYYVLVSRFWFNNPSTSRRGSLPVGNRSRNMTIQSSVIKVLLFLFAAIGLVTIVAIVGMALMHSSMMSMMGSPLDMAGACREVMGRLL